MIRSAVPADAQAFCDIYNPYVVGSTVTFEEEPVGVEEMRTRVARVQEHYPWLVCEDEGVILGYAYAAKWRTRAAYRHSVETTVYLRFAAQNRGIGSALYEALLAELRKLGVRAVIAGIALPNEASRRLHERFGFRKVAHFKEVGYKFGAWLDVGYWELLLEPPEADAKA